MQAWQAAEMKKTMGGLKSVRLTVWRADHVWTNPGNPDHKMWRLIAEKDDQLIWLHTYTESLAKEGTHSVEMYLNNHGQRCVRNPKKEY